MRNKVKLFIISSLLVGSVVFCTIRWKAWFATPPEPIWEGDTLSVSFKTFADQSIWESLQQEELEFIILGDIHSSLEPENFNSLLYSHSDVDFWAQLGDWIERPNFYYQQKMYHSVYGTQFAQLPVIAVPGNHEYHKGIIKQLSKQWCEIFPNPTNGPRRFLGRSYIVDFPSVRIITIDTDGLHRMSDYTQVCYWLKQSLQSAKDRFTIVMMHHPVFSTAKGRQNPILWLMCYGALREADVVFSGHDHNYVRRTVEYKERFWTKQQPTVFITTTASNKNYPIKQRGHYDCSYEGSPVYEYIRVTKEMLHIFTYELKSGKMVDEIVLTNK